jgi:molybdopterin-guanine dinucleotide biosynthesis protein A
VAHRAKLTGVLLVGGASARFGSPKAHARLGGVTLAERAWTTLGAVCDERMAVGKLGDRLDLPFELVDDGTEVRAPLAGVVAGLRAAANDLCVVLPVDCPHVTPDALRLLANACADAAVPRRDRPLPGAFRKSALPVLARRLEAGELALRDALGELDAREVPLDPVVLTNVNTPEELEELQRPPTGSSPWGDTTRSRSAPVPTSETSISSSRSTNST